MLNEIVKIELKDIADVLSETGNVTTFNNIRFDLITTLAERLKSKFDINDNEANNVIGLIAMQGYILKIWGLQDYKEGERTLSYIIKEKGLELLGNYK